ncbi:MAG: DegV family EDD domain-containing protein [Dehalococcoidales bacterium]|jgi:DegV family protein with EDD domain|nr:DegV family protein [Dehalococcoidia bacterium]NCG34690.1 DegV family EDD domain-containing protein [Dehalococcoidales bacterium]
MSNIAIVTDSTCDLPKKIIEKYNISVVPLNVHFGEETFLDGIDLEPDAFFEKLSTSDTHPTTSQPSVGRFLETYNDLLKSHDFIISIHISDKLSATHSTALQAMNQLSNEKIRVIDSKNGTLGLGSLVHKVALINESDKDFESLINKTQDLVEKAEFFGLVPTLEYLAKGGRIGKAQEFFGSLLKVKPILSAVDGEIHPVGKVRTLNKGMDYIVDIVKENKIETLFVVHANHLERANLLIEKLDGVIDKKSIVISEFGPVVGTHLGPGAFGIGFITLE